MTYFPNLFSSNLDSDTEYRDWGFTRFPSGSPGKFQDNTFTSFRTHHSLIIIPYDAALWFKLLAK